MVCNASVTPPSRIPSPRVPTALLIANASTAPCNARKDGAHPPRVEGAGVSFAILIAVEHETSASSACRRGVVDSEALRSLGARRRPEDEGDRHRAF